MNVLPFLAGICEWFKSALSRWEEAKSLQCSMTLTGCPSYPTSPGEAVKQTVRTYAANSWGGITPEQIRQINKTIDTVQRLEMLGDIIGSSFDDDLYSSDNIDAITEHLNRPELDSDDAPYNPAMIDRQIAIMNGETQDTVYDQNWMRHELIEKSLMDQGMSYPEAHAAANKALGVEGDWDLWPTEIIEKFPEWLIGPAWKEPLRKRNE